MLKYSAVFSDIILYDEKLFSGQYHVVFGDICLHKPDVVYIRSAFEDWNRWNAHRIYQIQMIHVHKQPVMTWNLLIDIYKINDNITEMWLE